MKCTVKNLFILGMLAVAGAANAQVDGTYKAAYGSPLVLQDNQTNFGDSNLGQQFNSNGNELNAAYAYRTESDLFLFFPGNIGSDFTSFQLFIDSASGGQQQLLFGQSGISFGKMRRISEESAGFGNGLKFDSGFDADYIFHINGGGDPFTIYADMAIVGNSTGEIGDNRYNQGGVWCGSSPGSGLMNAGQWLTGMALGVNNSNTAGVEGGPGASALANTGLATGIEVMIPLSQLRATPTSALKVCALINGQGADFMSNQVLGGLGGVDNLGEPRAVDFSAIAGDQFFTVPASASAFRTISGNIRYGDVTNNFAPSSMQPAFSIELRDSSDVKIRDMAVSLDASGNYSISVPAGDYKIYAKPWKCLSKVFAADTTAGNVTLNMDFLLGDIKRDGAITTDDYLVLSNYFDQSDGVEYDDAWNAWRNYNAELGAPPQWADLDGNGAITTDDYLYLSNNFDLSDE